MMQDPIADMLARINNARRIGMREVLVPFSTIKESIAKILVEEKYLSGMKITGEGYKRILVLSISYQKGRSVIVDIKRISKPGLRRYARIIDIPKIQAGRGMLILSTPKGIMTAKEARKIHVGGEVICKVL
jgi:small subunit ribosomal protein S8